MGRPKKTELRNQQLNLKLTRAERESLVTRAKTCGMRPGEYGRIALLGASAAPREGGGSLPSSAEIAFLTAIKRLGQNLNQLVRHMHITGRAEPASLEPLLQEIRRLLNRGIGG